ncbi:hypothetical protein Tco_0346776, partial [Tanacetum coccineum]
QVARRNERIQVREDEINRFDEEVESLKVVEAEAHGLRNQTKNLETLLEAEVDMKKATKAKNAELAKELKSLIEERIKDAFEEFKKYEDNKVEQRSSLGHWARPTPGRYEVRRIYRDKASVC